MKIGTLFSGGGLVDIGAINAGLKPVFAVEYDKDIAQVYRENIGEHVIVDSIVNVDPKTLPKVDLLWASPPCQGYSVARSKALPERTDKDLGLEVIRFLEELLPDYFILENVPPYKKSVVLAEILSALERLGYWYDYSVLNAADFGVPQSRKRLILRASRVGMLPNLPQKEKHQGWLSAIADLVDDLPDGKFANWQMKYLEKEYGGSFMADEQEHAGNGMTIRLAEEPSYTLLANERHLKPRAFLVNVNGSERSSITRSDDAPTLSVLADHISSKYRIAFLARVDGMECDGYVNDLLIDADSASPTITSQRPAASYRAILAGGQRRSHESISYTDAESSPTVTSSKSAMDFKALVRYQERGESKIINQDDPISTLTAKHTAAEYRWIKDGRVVQLTPQCMARFQTIPDWYKIPTKKVLAARIIGNGVPCLMVEKLIRNLMNL